MSTTIRSRQPAAPLPRLDIVVPCYNEEAVLPVTAPVLLEVLEALVAENRVARASQILFVDDGSRDGTWEIVRRLADTSPHYAGIKLSRNRGHQAALLAGLMTSGADAVVSIDADLQDDVRAIVDMVRHFNDGCDVVYGVRRERSSDTAFKRLTAGAYYRLMRRLGVDLVHQHADFRLMSRRALEGLREYGEANLFLRGLVPQLGFKSASVGYERSPRFAGESKYPLRRMLSLALNGVTSFSAAPLRLVAALGALVFAGSLLMTIWVLWTRLFTGTAVPGWASTVIPMYFLGGIQLLGIGVLGEYLARIFVEVKQRPRYHLEASVGLKSEEPRDPRDPVPSERPRRTVRPPMPSPQGDWVP